MLVLAFAPASAHAGSSQIAGGLHIATGALVDPDGRTWVADHNAGFCRVSPATEDGAGTIEHPQRPDGPGPRTCLGGLLPGAAPGPDAAGAPVLVDPSPEFPDSGDEMALIPDGASPSSEVVRARWNKDTGLFTFLDTVTMLADRGRPQALSVGPDENVYVTFQREASIQRIVAPASGAPRPEIVGLPSDGRGPAAVAAGRDSANKLTVYVAESLGLRKLHPSATAPPLTEPAWDVPAPGGAEPTAISALSYDLDRNVLWAGTANGVTAADDGEDTLMRIDIASGVVDASHTAGFTMVGGVNAAADGTVLVLDDPALVDPAEPLGMGRMFLVGPPAAHVARGPLTDGVEAPDRSVTRDATPGFEITGDGTQECLLRGPGRAGEWAACPPGGRLDVTDRLLDGTYRLAVRATVDGRTGPTESHRFTVDTTAPATPRIAVPLADETVGSSPWYAFDAEDGVTFSCRFDATSDEDPYTDCAPGRTRSFPGDTGPTGHTLELKATDRAGNTSTASAVRRFTVDPALEPTEPPSFGPGPTHRGSSLFTEGLHISTGAIVDPDGRVWVSDHNAGFCRTTPSNDDGPGRIEHPEQPTDRGPRTCLGGLLPLAGTGPDAAGQPAFVDPTPARPGSGDEVVLIPDGASPSSEVVRVRWNPGSGLFEYLDAITMVNGGRGARPVAASLGPDGAVYVVFQKSDTVQRISSPASGASAVDVVGVTSDGRGAAAVAAGRDLGGAVRVYVAESSGLRVLAPNSVLPPATGASFALPDAAVDAGGPTNVSALAYDLREDRLWVGTADGVTQADAGRDRIHRITIASGTVDAGYATGYSMIGGFGLRSDGMLYVADDPALLDPAEPNGTGRLFQVGLPAAHIVRGPLNGDVEAPDRGQISDATPEFEIGVGADEGIAECRLTGGELGPGAWAPCSRTGRFTPAASLADGNYVLAVRAVAGPVTGLVEVHRFSVDTTPPARPVIVSPEQDAIVSASPWFAFTSESGSRYECRWDAGAFAPCEPGRTRTFLQNATHELQIRAIDRAGNVSEGSDVRRFAARANVTKVTIDSGPAGPTTARDATFTFSADLADVQFGCRLSGQPFTICTGPKSYTGLKDGTYTFEVRAKDQAGNVTPLVGRTFTVDTRGPVAQLQGPGEGETIGTSAVTMVLGADEAGSTFSCRLDGAPFGPCATPHVLSGLQDGSHTFDVVATDALGNQGAILSRRFTVVAGFTPPPPPVGPAPGTTVTVTDQASRLPVVLRIADIDRRVKLDRLREEGITVTIIPATGTKLIRFQIFKAPGGRRGRAAPVGRAAAAKAGTARGKLVATVYRKGRKGRFTVTFTRRELRKLTAGSYRLEVAGGSSRSRLGKSVTRNFTVTR